MSEGLRPTPPEISMTRRRFLRRFSYILGTGSAVMIGGGAGIVVNASRVDPDMVRFNLPSESPIQSDQQIRVFGQFMGGLTTLAGAALATASYLIWKENRSR